MKCPIAPIKPYISLPEPKEEWEKHNQIDRPISYESINLFEYIALKCDELKINIKDVFVSYDENTCYDCNRDGYWNIFYKTYIINKNYKSELKKYNKHLKEFNLKLEQYNLEEKKYQEEMSDFEIYKAKQIIANAEKKKAAIDREVKEAKKKLK